MSCINLIRLGGLLFHSLSLSLSIRTPHAVNALSATLRKLIENGFISILVGNAHINLECVNLEWKREADVLIADYSNRITSHRNDQQFCLAHSTRGTFLPTAKATTMTKQQKSTSCMMNSFVLVLCIVLWFDLVNIKKKTIFSSFIVIRICLMGFQST